MNQLTKKSLFWGVAAGLLLLFLYFLILSLANSFSHALEQFQVFYIWLLILSAGFGLQVGLYSYIHQKSRQNQSLKTARKEIAGAAGISTTSMIACCAHHLVDVLPILGLSVVFLFLARYQLFFIILGIASNIIGIIFMLEMIKKHSLSEKDGFLSRAVKFDLAKMKYLTIAVFGLVLLAVFFRIRNSRADNAGPEADTAPVVVQSAPEVGFRQEPKAPLDPKFNNEGGLSVEVRPVNFSPEEPLRFEVFLNTHQGDLDFDPVEKSILIDDRNNQYKALEWQGERGGHHLSGVLVFPALTVEAKEITLKISDIYGVKERNFAWDLK